MLDFCDPEGNWEKGKMGLRVDTRDWIVRCVAGRSGSKDKLKVVVLGQKDHEFEAQLGYIVNSRQAQVTA